MSKIHTHYDNLKVARDAPPEVIRAAYKTLCHKFHPDRHRGSVKATQTFQLINAAYEVLSDPVRRHQHDAWIARAEVSRPPPRAYTAAPSWNGRERRRRPWVTTPVGSSATAPGGRLKRPTAMLALWASVGVLSAMLVMLYHT
jgi:curved DNA-binding protein CbpA